MLVFLGLSTFVLGQESTSYNFYRWDEEKQTHLFDFKQEKIESTLDSLQKSGYYTLALDSVIGTNVYLNKGKLYKRLWVYNNELFKNTLDYFPTTNLDSILTTLADHQNTQGYVFNQIKIHPQGIHEGEQRVKLEMIAGKQRTIDRVVSVDYDKISQGYLKHGLGLKRGSVYTDQKIDKASQLLNQTNYITEIRSPQTLFRPDSTIVYLYPERLKSNFFDGILGFGTDEEGDFKLNGNIQLELNNVFNNLEQIKLNWIATASKNTTLNVGVRLPYLFKSRIGSETHFKLFKQDSVFVNLNLNQRLFYQLNLHASIGVNALLQNSNYLLDYDANNNAYDDFKKTGFGLSYQYALPHSFRLMEGKSLLEMQVNSMTRKENNFSWTTDIQNEKTNQYEVALRTYRLFELSKRHYLKGLLEFKGLFSDSDQFSDNELYRIGGFGSLRGFNEESILANNYALGSLEYRFVPNEGFYIALFTDYALIENKRIDVSTNLMSIGTGLSFLTGLGIFNLSYAVGKTQATSFDFKESKIHFGIVSQF